MALYKISFTAIILNFLLFLTFAAANEEAMHECIASMAHYCNIESDFPIALFCIRAAFNNWLLDDFPEGYMKEYYRSFDGKLDPTGMLAPHHYCKYVCHDGPVQYKYKCLGDLYNFGETVESALYHALYYTNSASFPDPDQDESNEYLRAIRMPMSNTQDLIAFREALRSVLSNDSNNTIDLNAAVPSEGGSSGMEIDLNSEAQPERNKFGSMYMAHIKMNVYAPRIVGDLDPWNFCKEKFFPGSEKEFDWKPYIDRRNQNN